MRAEQGASVILTTETVTALAELIEKLTRDGHLLKRAEIGTHVMSVTQLSECEQHIHEAIQALQSVRAQGVREGRQEAFRTAQDAVIGVKSDRGSLECSIHVADALIEAFEAIRSQSQKE